MIVSTLHYKQMETDPLITADQSSVLGAFVESTFADYVIDHVFPLWQKSFTKTLLLISLLIPDFYAK